MKHPSFCLPLCIYLKPTEREQTDNKEPHMCTRYNERVVHGSQWHPHLLRLDECDYKRYDQGDHIVINIQSSTELFRKEAKILDITRDWDNIYKVEVFPEGVHTFIREENIIEKVSDPDIQVNIQGG